MRRTSLPLWRHACRLGLPDQQARPTVPPHGRSAACGSMRLCRSWHGPSMRRRRRAGSHSIGRCTTLNVADAPYATSVPTLAWAHPSIHDGMAAARSMGPRPGPGFGRVRTDMLWQHACVCVLRLQRSCELAPAAIIWHALNPQASMDGGMHPRRNCYWMLASVGVRVRAPSCMHCADAIRGVWRARRRLQLQTGWPMQGRGRGENLRAPPPHGSPAVVLVEGRR